MMNLKIQFRALGAALILGLLLAGCASAPDAPVESLADRVDTKWQALTKGDYRTAYAFYSPGYRQTVTYEAFLRGMLSRTIRWTGAQVDDVSDCDESVCKVRVAVFYSTKAPTGGGAWNADKVLYENWIKSGDNWYFVPEGAL